MSNKIRVEQKRDGTYRMTLLTGWDRLSLLQALSEINSTERLIVGADHPISKGNKQVVSQCLWQLQNIADLNKSGKIEIEV